MLRFLRFRHAVEAVVVLVVAGCAAPPPPQYPGYVRQPVYLGPQVPLTAPIGSPIPSPGLGANPAPPGLDGGGLSLVPDQHAAALYRPPAFSGHPQTVAAENSLLPIDTPTHKGRLIVQPVSAPLNRTRLEVSQRSSPPSGMAATPQEDLQYRGGNTIQNLSYINVYVGGAEAWSEAERKSINSTLEAAMTDPHLNHVLMQYFNDQPITSEYRGAFLLTGFNPQRVAPADLRQLIRMLHTMGSFASLPLKSTTVNFLLPKGMILADPHATTGTTNPLAPVAAAGDSRQGLSGYHGSVHVGDETVYFAITVYSERRGDGFRNGIPVFTEPWKNVVAAAYHQLQEVRTDPDVDDANSTGNQRYLGWVNQSGDEVADIAIKLASDLRSVMKEVPLANGSGMVPVQLNYSNFAHGPEGPIAVPHGGIPLPPGKQLPKPSPTPTPQPIVRDLNWLNQEWTNLPDTIQKQIIRIVEGYIASDLQRERL